MKRLRALFLRPRFFLGLILIGIAFILGFFFPILEALAWCALAALVVFLLIDIGLLFGVNEGVKASRDCGDKFSNGDDNPVTIKLTNLYTQKRFFLIIDEAPPEFQRRDLFLKLALNPGETSSSVYHLHPVRRGNYIFGTLNIFAYSVFGLVMRKYKFDSSREVAVYPSFIQMRKYELLAISNQLLTMGIKKIRRIGNNREFEQIEKYVPGDDYRKINWKATARRNQLMINHYQDERSQHVYSLIDKGRTMEMPFEEMSLLDYAINASLVISNIAVRKSDKAGLITFQDNVETVVPASSRNRQMNEIMEHLYREKTSHREHDFSRLYISCRHILKQRSLLLLYTNFESIYSLRRQLPYLRMINQQHLLVVIVFRNTAIEEMTHTKAFGIENIYKKGIAEQLMFEKRLMVNEMVNQGIQCVLTAPKDLTIDTINKYLELKSRGLI